MKQLSGKELVALLERNGWRRHRQKGSTVSLKKPYGKVIITVPLHGNKPLKAGLLVYLLKLAELKEEDFE
jgi:predicted RNA binding protein YcfA (HicA-like mRNA interferase family)